MSFSSTATKVAVIPAYAGIQFVGLTALKINSMHHLDSIGLRGNDGFGERRDFSQPARMAFSSALLKADLLSHLAEVD
ncbi:MAG: hypothetical protein MUE86_00850 [Thiobacillaceae bacterium]|nr:hypothetical protein [Thiobacillaceae bacterium]